MSKENASTDSTKVNEEEDYDPQFEFSECCKYSDEDTGIAIFQSYDVDPCKPDENGTTPLHAIAANGLDKLLSVVLKKPNLNLNVQTPDGYTPLHYAAMLRKNLVIEMLVRAGADGKIKNKYGQSPIYEVCTSLSEEDREKSQSIIAEEAKTIDLLIGPDSEIPDSIQVPNEEEENFDENPVEEAKK